MTQENAAAIRLTPEADAWLRGRFQTRSCKATGSFDIWAVCASCGVRIPVARMAVMRQIKHGTPIPCTHCRGGLVVPQRKPHAEE